MGCARGDAAAPLAECVTAGMAMRTYYFDMNDSTPTRNRNGLEFATHAGAIEHCRDLASRLRRDPRITNPALSVIVVDEAGTEIHSEPVNPSAAKTMVA